MLYVELQEEQLLALIKDGDYSAFDELYHRHWSTLYGAAYNILRDVDVCMDIIQDIFTWFWENRDQWQLSSSKGYLLTAVRFKAANYIRNSKVRDSFFSELSKLQVNVTDEHVALEVQELQAFIKRFTDQLPERCRLIFQMSRFEHMSNKEIAAKLNISEKTIEAQITIALKRLKSNLGNASYLLFLFL